MKITESTARPERKLTINLIMSDRFCKEILPLIRPQYFQLGFAREVSSWIAEYYTQFKQAPKKAIRDLYHAKRPYLHDEDEIDEISEFLKSLSKEYEQLETVNIEYEIKVAEEYLRTRSLEVLANALNDAVLENNPVKGEQVVGNYKRVGRPLGEGLSLLRDTQQIVDAFTEEDEVLFTFPGALGEVAGKFSRGDFVSFLAPMKRGKTWWLGYSGETALHFGLKCVFFTLEMTKRQMVRRQWRSLLGQPKYNMEITLPFFEKTDDAERVYVNYRTEERAGVNPSEIERFQKKFRRKFRKGDMRIIALPSKSATVDDLNAHLDNMGYYDNYQPDVVVIDYADLLLPGKNIREYRHGLDDIWASLRRLAQERNILVITASQTEKGTFSKDVNEASVAEDVRKIAHITCGLALNQTKSEAEGGIIRISQVVAREERRAFQQAVVIQCLDIGRPYLDSRLRNEVSLAKETVEDEGGDYGRKN